MPTNVFEQTVFCVLHFSSSNSGYVAALSTHVQRHDQYWTNSLRQIAGQEEEKTFKLRTEDEYKLVFESILNCTQPCNVLVFGVAWDAMLLMEANWLGKTVFLEDNFKWQALVRFSYTKFSFCGSFIFTKKGS